MDALTERIAEIRKRLDWWRELPGEPTHGGAQWMRDVTALMDKVDSLEAALAVQRKVAEANTGAAMAYHQAEQVRAVLGETTTEWGVRGWWEPTPDSTYRATSREHATRTIERWGGNLVTRTVTPWIEAP